MTPKEHQMLDFIRHFISIHRYSPTIAEIATGIHAASRGTVYRYLEKLEAAGQLILKGGKQRNIELTSQGWCDAPQGLKLPLLGKIAAGKPIEAILTQEQVDFSHLAKSNHYALKICGNSMIDEGIRDGDLVICRQADQANNGDIVVALVDNEFATLKRFYHHGEKGKVTLKPENQTMEPVTYDAHRIVIQGILIGLLRLPT